MEEIFYINHQSYTIAQLNERAQIGGGEEWEKSHWNFIRNWFDDSSFISAKTSGSTGEAKQIAIPKKSMIASAQLTQEYFNFQKGITALVALPSEFVGGKMMILRSLLFGYHQIWKKPSTQPLSELSQQVDFAALTPLQVTDQLKNDPASFHKVDTIIIGGQKVSDHLCELLQPINTRFVSTYGMTETTSHIALKELNRPKQDFYNALGNTTVHLDDRQCLVIDAPHLNITGLVTNDIAECISTNQFRIIGRNDFVINSGGAKVNPELVEDKIASLIDVPFLITAISDERLGQKIILVIESPSWSIDAVDVLNKELRKRLNSVELPREIFFTPQLQRTPTGKIIRQWK